MKGAGHRRSHEPVVWLLFAAGGTIAAMVLPAVIFVIGLAGPAGLLSEAGLDYDRVRALVDGPVGRLLVFAVVSLLFWHAMHRIFHGLHDLGVHTHLHRYRVLSYGLALVATIVTAGLVIAL